MARGVVKYVTYFRLYNQYNLGFLQVFISLLSRRLSQLRHQHSIKQRRKPVQLVVYRLGYQDKEQKKVRERTRPLRVRKHWPILACAQPPKIASYSLYLILCHLPVGASTIMQSFNIAIVHALNHLLVHFFLENMRESCLTSRFCSTALCVKLLFKGTRH